MASLCRNLHMDLIWRFQLIVLRVPSMGTVGLPQATLNHRFALRVMFRCPMINVACRGPMTVTMRHRQLLTPPHHHHHRQLPTPHHRHRHQQLPTPPPIPQTSPLLPLSLLTEGTPAARSATMAIRCVRLTPGAMQVNPTAATAGARC